MGSNNHLSPRGFLTIPLELRQDIYRHALQPSTISLFDQGNRKRPNRIFQPILNIFLSCRTIYAEAYKLYFSECTVLIKNYSDMQGNSEASLRLAGNGDKVFQRWISKMPPKFHGLDSPLHMVRRVRLDMPYSCSLPFFAELCSFLPASFPALQELYLIGSKASQRPCMGYTRGTIRWDEKETSPDTDWVRYFTLMRFSCLEKVVVIYRGRYKRDCKEFEEFFDVEWMREYICEKLCGL